MLETHRHLVQMTFVLSVKERCPPVYLHTPLDGESGVTSRCLPVMGAIAGTPQESAAWGDCPLSLLQFRLTAECVLVLRAWPVVPC